MSLFRPLAGRALGGRPLAGRQIGSDRTVTPGKGVGYRFVNAEAEALVARFTTPPDNTRKALIDTLMGVLKSVGLSKFDAFYVTAAHDAQAARRNWIADAFNLSLVNSPVFVADRGYTGNGSTSYLDSGFNPTTAPSPKFTKDNAHAFIWPRTDLDNAGGVSWDFGTNVTRIARFVGVPGQVLGRANMSTSNNAMVGAGAGHPGHVGWCRSGAAAYEAYGRGVSSFSGTTASAAPVNAPLTIGALGDLGVYGVNQISAAHFGSNLTAGEVLTVKNALQTYLQAVGAA